LRHVGVLVVEKPVKDAREVGVDGKPVKASSLMPKELEHGGGAARKSAKSARAQVRQ
jgi:hypothetical protein